MVFINRFKRVIILCFVFLLCFNFIASPKKAMAGGEVLELPYYLYILALAIAADAGIVATNQADINAIGMQGGAYLQSQQILDNADINKIDVSNGTINTLSVEDGYALNKAKQREDVQAFYKVGKNAISGFCDFISDVVAEVSTSYDLPASATLSALNPSISFVVAPPFCVTSINDFIDETGHLKDYRYTIANFSVNTTQSIGVTSPFTGFSSFLANPVEGGKSFKLNIFQSMQTQNYIGVAIGNIFLGNFVVGSTANITFSCDDFNNLTTDFDYSKSAIKINNTVSTTFNDSTTVPINAIDNYTDVVGVSDSSYIALSPTDTMIAGGVGLNDTISTANPLSTVFPSAQSLNDVKGLISTGEGADVTSNTGSDSLVSNSNSTFFDWLLDILKQALGWFGELLKAILQGLFVPSDTYLESRVMSIKSSLQKKLPYEDYTKLFHEGYAAKGLEDIKVTIYGQTVVIVKVTTFEKFRDICNSIIMAFVFFMLAIYNYNNIYKLIRGSDYVSTKKTFGNMIGNNNSNGGKE